MSDIVLVILSFSICAHFSYLLLSNNAVRRFQLAIVWIRMFYSSALLFVGANILEIFSVFGITNLYFQLLKSKGSGLEIEQLIRDSGNIIFILLTFYCAFVFLPRKSDAENYLAIRAETLKKASFLLKRQIPKFPPLTFVALTMLLRF